MQHGSQGAAHRRGQCQGVLALALEAQPETAHAAQHQPRLERAEDRTAQQAFGRDRRHQVGVVAGDVSGEDITVTGQRLGRTAHYEIRTQRQRLLAQRCRGGVVHHQPAAPAATDRGQPRQVDHVQSGIRRGLGEDQVGALGCVAELRRTGFAHRDPQGGKAFGGVASYLEIAVGGNREHRAGPGQRPQCRGHRGHPGTERDRRRRALQPGQCRLQPIPAGAGLAAVGVRFGALVGGKVEG